MRAVFCWSLLLTACGSVEERAATAPRQVSTAFVATEVADVCNADEARVEDQTGAEFGNNCEPGFVGFPQPFGPPGVFGCLVADFGSGASYGEVQVIAYSWPEERCGRVCDDVPDLVYGTLDIFGADDVLGTNHVQYGSFTAGEEGDMGNPAVSDPRRYVFVCLRAELERFVRAVDVDVIRVE